ncbi:MAG: hypothetical protein DRM97_07820 [Thermoprotei archaeon]|nr:MAG: hypothetical protein DRM97_07820 [Thermoprotei archaeon]
MKVIRGQHVESTQNTIIALTGNGASEGRVLTALAEKLDPPEEPKIILMPQTSGRTGLEPTIDTLAGLIVTGLVTKTYAIVIDKEHLKEEPEDHIREALQDHGFTIHNFIKLSDDLYRITCIKGEQLDIYIATLGITPKGNLEEHLAELIKLRYGEQVEPDKRAISRWLRQNQKKLEDLIREATRNQLQRALKPLYQLIETLRKDPPEP